MSRRDQIRMSDAETDAFLRAQKTLILVSNGARGFPHPMPMWFARDPDGAIRMTTFRKSQKVRNLERDPRVSLLVEDGEEYAELRGVVLYGQAELRGEIEWIVETLRRASGAADAADPEARKTAEAFLRRTAEKRIGIRVAPERVFSWDHRKLGGVY